MSSQTMSQAVSFGESGRVGAQADHAIIHTHTWFVLKYLLGLENVRNYDGSWTEYGNIVGAQIGK